VSLETGEKAIDSILPTKLVRVRIQDGMTTDPEHPRWPDWPTIHPKSGMKTTDYTDDADFQRIA